MKQVEQEIREGITLLKKLDFIRNELFPYYVKETSLEDVEKSLWAKYKNILKTCCNENR